MNMDINFLIAIKDLLLSKEYKPSEMSNFIVIMNEIEKVLQAYSEAKQDENKETPQE